MVLVGFKDAPQKHREYGGRLCAFDLHDPDTLLWSVGSTAEALDMPDVISRAEGSSFRVSFVGLDDVFPERPGREIVLAQRMNKWSPSVLQILARDGSVLYSIWHDGVLYDFRWLSEPKLNIPTPGIKKMAGSAPRMGGVSGPAWRS